MRLKQKIVLKIKGMPRIPTRIAYEINISIQTAYRWIAQNKENGDLTRLKILQILSEELNVPIDDLLEHK